MKSIEKDIFDYLAGNLSPKRFEHSYNVSLFACELAEIYGADILSARLAGLLHDCAKFMTAKQMQVFFKNKKNMISHFKEISGKSPELLHSFVAAEIVKTKFNIKNPDILNAVKNHTLGRKNMSLLEKILFVADAVSYDRKYKKAAAIRKLAKEDINKAFAAVLANKITYVINEGKWLCPLTIDTWNYYAS